MFTLSKKRKLFFPGQTGDTIEHHKHTEGKALNNHNTDAFVKYLRNEEKSDATVEKYTRDVACFLQSIGEREPDRESVLDYKKHLIDSGYAVRSINSMLASLNCWFAFLGRPELKVKSLKVQQQIFCPEEKELTRAEYERLCAAAERSGNKRISLILQTICATGIRVSELKYITVEAVRCGAATVSCKAKTRTVFIVRSLQKKLLRYISEQGIRSGSVFVTRNGNPINRTSIWSEMKKLCSSAGVDQRKVYPHNLRHLFARVFYSLEKDIAKLADILGHSSINTTRIYIMSTGSEHRRRMERMRLTL